MNLWFTSDPHFLSEDTFIREKRPFSSVDEYTTFVVNTWNKQTRSKDVIYVIGDFVSYGDTWESGLKVVKRLKSRVVLITGNNELSIIRDNFDGSFILFKNYCQRLGFLDVCKSQYVRMNMQQYYLTHMPINKDPECTTLFGHVHKGLGQYRKYGFNMFLDINYFRLYSSADIKYLEETKRKYWDKSANFNEEVPIHG